MFKRNGTLGFGYRLRGAALICAAALLAVAAAGVFREATAQPPSSFPDELADQALTEPPADAQTGSDDAVQDAGTSAFTVPILELLFKGGWLMAPIVVMSFLVVAIGIERALGLRRGRVFPKPLRNELESIAARGDFEPRHLYQFCQRHSSNAATVVRAMLLKVGRPHAEVEHAVSESIQREADRLYTPVRTLNLAAAITPLMGLLGTVWGMIEAFFATANLPIGSNKGQALAEGIYVALVTTFAGLAVAIPAAVLAHVFESRILSQLRDIEQSLGALLPQIEQYEGKLRIDHHHLTRMDPRDVAPSDRGQTKAS